MHVANYRRSPRGVSEEVAALHDRRFSFCCNRDGCRSRRSPRSVRFLGRRVYLFVTVLLASVLNHGLNERRQAQLAGLLQMSDDTLRRWRRWWVRTFPATGVWQTIRGRFFPPAVDLSKLPGTLLDYFPLGEEQRVRKLLEMLSPLSGV